MDVNNPNTANTWIGDDGSAIHCKRIPIGIWNMDATNVVNVPHGLAGKWKQILSVSVYIRNDNDNLYFSLGEFADFADPLLISGGINQIDNTNIVLRRRTGGGFGFPDFDDGAINRGYVIIMYYQ